MVVRESDKRGSFRVAAITLVVFGLTIVSRDLLFSISSYAEFIRAQPEVIRWLENPVREILLCVIGLYVAHRTLPWKAFGSFGLGGSAWRGLLFGLLVTLPMAIPAFVWGRMTHEETAISLLFLAGVWPIGEEIVFRGYAFRQLHRYAGWGFWSAAIVIGLVFGLLHLGVASVRGMSLGGQMGTVAIIGAGGILFAWLFVRWNDNLWVPFAVHGFMNLWWTMFDISDTPLGGVGANVMRVACGVLAIVLSIWRPRWLCGIPPIETAG